MSNFLDSYYALKFFNLLTTDYKDLNAFKLGIIDEFGRPLKKRKDLKTQDEKSAYNLFTMLVLKLRKILQRLPMGTALFGKYAMALNLVKECVYHETGSLNFLDNKYYMTEESIKMRTFKEFLNEAEEFLGEGAISQDLSRRYHVLYAGKQQKVALTFHRAGTAAKAAARLSKKTGVEHTVHDTASEVKEETITEFVDTTKNSAEEPKGNLPSKQQWIDYYHKEIEKKQRAHDSALPLDKPHHKKEIKALKKHIEYIKRDGKPSWKEDASSGNFSTGVDNQDGMIFKGGVKDRKDVFGGDRIFDIDSDKFHKARHGKKKHDRYSKYVGDDETGEQIRQYGRKNPKDGIVLRDKTYKVLQYFRRNRKDK